MLRLATASKNVPFHWLRRTWPNMLKTRMTSTAKLSRRIGQAAFPRIMSLNRMYRSAKRPRSGAGFPPARRLTWSALSRRSVAAGECAMPASFSTPVVAGVCSSGFPVPGKGRLMSLITFKRPKKLLVKLETRPLVPK